MRKKKKIEEEKIRNKNLKCKKNKISHVENSLMQKPRNFT